MAEQIIISFSTAFIASLITYWFTGRAYDKNFILEKTYDIHKKLLDKLVNFFYETDVYFDLLGYQKDKKIRSRLKKEQKMTYREYCEKAPKSLFQDIHQIRNIKDYINKFENWIEDIKEVSFLSNKKTRKIAKDIVKKYLEHKSEESLLQESIIDEIGFEKSPDEHNPIGGAFYEFKNNVNWEIFWTEIIGELKKLKNSLEKFVALK